MKDYDQQDQPPGTGAIRFDGRIEWFLFNGSWYQAGATMPQQVKEAWLAEHMRLDREEKRMNRLL